MIRLTLLWLFMAVILVYSWKNWYAGLCGLILLMGVIEHPDMPKGMLGIPGFNPFNLLLMDVVFACLAQRRAENLKWDMPKHVTLLMALFLLLIGIGFVRLLRDPYWVVFYFRDTRTAQAMLNEFLINTVKWAVPGMLVFYGCNSRERFNMALTCTIGMYVLLGLQVIKWMPPQFALDGVALAHRSLRVLQQNVGFSRVNLSAMLAATSWAIYATKPLFDKPWHRVGVIALSGLTIYAQAMTAGRAGYVTWALVGLVLCAIRWRVFLVVAPILVASLLFLVPGVAGRMTEGFTAETVDTNRRLEEEGLQRTRPGQVDAYTVTAGRVIAWPVVIEKIREKPYVGWGREAMLRSGTSWFLYDNYGEMFPHPHNAYLECLIDNGVIGAAIILPFYLLLLWSSLRLFLDRKSVVCGAAGGVASAFLLALMFAAFGSQSFYPTEGWVGLWCAVGLVLRVKLERAKALAAIEGGPEAARPSSLPPTRFHRPGVPATVLAARASGPRPPATAAHAFRRPAAAASGAAAATPFQTDRGGRAARSLRQPAAPPAVESSPRLSIDSLLWGHS